MMHHALTMNSTVTKFKSITTLIKNKVSKEIEITYIQFSVETRIIFSDSTE